MTAIWNFFKLLPELIALAQAVDKAAKEAAIERKTADDLKAIRKAFNDKDPNALAHVFNPPAAQ
jgi:hypothetical protein